jgi:hypothetical protein
MLSAHQSSIVIHHYRWRLGLADGESKYDDWEKRIAAAPVISVPAITLMSIGFDAVNSSSP